jgi:hypothetical protein
MINHPTKYFQGIFILPSMRLNGKDRILDLPDDLEHIFEGDREYGGEDDQINYIISFNYDEIPELVNNFKNWTYGFFRSKADTAFMY